MSLAITGAARLADRLAPLLLAGADAATLDQALAAYDAERRPAAQVALEANHTQAMRIWGSELFRDPDAYVRAVDPTSGWGAGGAGWGQDPAALSQTATGAPRA
jgi:2-polyprenyl-6-methoxyphenol hydroxylase-like FAD-dependent oxidoreductase